MCTYEFTPSGLRELKNLSKDIQRKIITKLDFFIVSGKPLSFAQHLINYDIGQYRFRIGDWRVIFDVEDEKLVIHAIGHRKEIYR